ncbi:MAG: DNA-binding response regulator [Acidobacteria bacterium]|nr:MAG: DNA-binding response regulator [Acidobacteriota bacterium]
MAVRILIADDDEQVRGALRFILEHEGFSVAEAADGIAAASLARELQPDLALLDLSMPRADGLEAGRAIRETCPDTILILLTAHSRKHQVITAFRAGFRGYVVKSDAPDDLLRAIRDVRAGKTFLSPTASRAVIEQYLPEPDPVPQ